MGDKRWSGTVNSKVSESIGDCRGVLSGSVCGDSDGMIGDSGDSGGMIGDRGDSSGIVDLGDRGGMIGDRGESGVDSSDDDDTGDLRKGGTYGSYSDSDSDSDEPNILSDQLVSGSIPWKYLGVVDLGSTWE